MGRREAAAVTATDDPPPEEGLPGSAQHGRARALRLVEALQRHPAAILLFAAAATGALVAPLAPNSDAQTFLTASAQLRSAEWRDVFASSYLQVGPTYLAVLAALSATAQMLGLPVLALVGAVESLAVTALALAASKGLTRASNVWAVGLPLVGGGLLTEALLNGHPEELATGLCLAIAMAAARKGAVWWPSVLVAFAATTKLWGVLGVVAVVAVHDSHRRHVLRRSAFRLLLLSALTAGVYGPFILWGKFATLQYVWHADASSPLGIVTGYHGAFPVPARIAQLVLPCVAGALLAVYRRPTGVLTVAIVAARLLLDPQRQNYYYSALLLLVVIAAWSTADPVWRRLRWPAVCSVPVLTVLPYFLTSFLEGLLDLALLGLVFVAVLLCGREAGTPRRDRAIQRRGNRPTETRSAAAVPDAVTMRLQRGRAFPRT
jgi:hypothetical protein